MDVIELRDLRALGRHGVLPGERDREQPFDIDVRIEIDLREAGNSDDLGDTVDYDRLRKQIVEIVQGTSFGLLERLGLEILDAIFRDPRVAHAEVAIAKPQALEGATPIVRLRRDNPRFRGLFG